MTAYVLVPGGHMGGRLWQDVVDRLRERGAEAHAATLTGMGDRRHLAGPETDLETHIEDLVQLIDHVDAPEVVLVAHCHGSFPALGAADRRPERVSRIVYVSAPLPMDGYSVHGLVNEFEPDPAVRDGWRRRAEQAEDGWRIPRRHSTTRRPGAASQASPRTRWPGSSAWPRRSRWARSPSRSGCRGPPPGCR